MQIFGTVLKTRKLQLQRREKLRSSRVHGAKESGESSGPARKKLKVTPKNSSCSDNCETAGRDKPKVVFVFFIFMCSLSSRVYMLMCPFNQIGKIV